MIDKMVQFINVPSHFMQTKKENHAKSLDNSSKDTFTTQLINFYMINQKGRNNNTANDCQQDENQNHTF